VGVIRAEIWPGAPALFFLREMMARFSAFSERYRLQAHFSRSTC
jgi:hypothetical protein